MTYEQAQIIERARRYVGVPYRHKGRDPSTGLDCMGLIVRIWKDLGWTEADYVRYGHRPSWTVLHGLLRDSGLTMGEMDYGAFAIFSSGGLPHAAVLADGGKPYSIIHADQHTGKQGRVVEHRLSEEWQRSRRLVLRFCWVRRDASCKWPSV